MMDVINALIALLKDSNEANLSRTILLALAISLVSSYFTITYIDKKISESVTCLLQIDTDPETQVKIRSCVISSSPIGTNKADQLIDHKGEINEEDVSHY